MRLIRKIALLLLLAFTVVGAYAQNLQQYIPSDATFVVSMNLGNLDSKISFEKLKQYDFYKDAMKEFEREMAREDESLGEIAKNPSSVGINVMKESYMFGKITEESSLFGFIFNISDNKKFTKFFKEKVLPEANGVMGKTGKFETMSTNEATFAWNDKVGILVGGDVKENIEEGTSRETPITAFSKSILSAKAKKSILADRRYLKATKGKKSDMRMWMDYQWIFDMQTQGEDMAGVPGMEGMMDAVKDLYKDTDYMVELNFNDGAIVMDSKLYSNEETMARIRKMTTGEINKDFFKYLPKDNLMGYMSLALNMANMADGMFEMFTPMIEEMGMTRTQLEDMALESIKALGVEMDRKGLYEIIKGDMVFAVTGMREFTVKKTQYDEDFNKIEVEAKQNLPEFAFMMSYGQEPAVDKFLEMGVAFSGLVKMGDAYKVAVPIPDIPMDIFLAKRDGILFVTNNNDLVSGNLVSGYSKANTLSKNHVDMLKNNGMAFFWDIPETLKAAAGFARDEGALDKNAEKIINVSKQSLESMVITADKEIKDNYSSAFKLNFVNKKMNSLDQLFSYINEIYLTSMSGGM
ncbi:MAG: DUF4836 family protein [Bacteroidota bacterium]